MRVDVVRKRQNTFVISVRILHCNFNLHAVNDFIKINRFFMKNGFVFVEEFNIAADAALIVENFFFISCAVNENDFQAFV